VTCTNNPTITNYSCRIIAGALPLVQTALPVRDQALITNEEASLGLALAVVGLIMSKKQ